LVDERGQLGPVYFEFFEVGHHFFRQFALLALQAFQVYLKERDLKIAEEVPERLQLTPKLIVNKYGNLQGARL